MIRRVTLNTGSGSRVGIFSACTREAKAEVRHRTGKPAPKNGLLLAQEAAM